ncbi:MAG TPA: DUF4124 domain-containing protein [Dokdonella sp.]
MAIAALANSPAHAAGAYKCTRADGSVSFQDQPCAIGAKQQRLSLPSDPYVAPAADDEQEPAADIPASTNVPARSAPPPPRVPPPSFFLCSRYDGTRYISQTGQGGGAAVPFGVLEDAQAFGPNPPGRGGHQVSHLAAATAGAYVWVDDRCHRAAPQEACAYLQSQLDDVLARIRSVSMDAEAPLKQQAEDLRERMRGC